MNGDVVEPLTSREREILVLLVEGSANASSRQIAGKLGISPRTIDTHRRRIKKKMQTHSQADLRHIAELCGALDPDTALYASFAGAYSA